MTKPLEALIADMKAAANKAKQADELYVEGKIKASECVAETRGYLDYSDDPKNMLALIAALEQSQTQSSKWLEAYHKAVSIGARYEERIAELEASETQLIDERDSAEEALADMYQAATGERPEWSNHFGFADAVEAVEQRLGELEDSQLAVNLPSQEKYDDPLSAYEAIKDCAEAIRAAGGTVGGE